MSIPVRTKCCPFHNRKRSNVINLQLIRQLADPPGEWCRSGDLVLVSGAGRGAPSSSCNQSGLGESTLLSPGIPSIPATMAALFLSLLGDDRGGWRKRLTCSHRMGHSIHLIIKILLCWGHPLVSIHPGYKFLHVLFFAHSEMSIHIPLPQISLSLISQSYSFQSFTIQPNHWPQPIHQYIIACLAISPSKQSDQPGALLRVLSTSKIPLHHCPSERFQKGTVALQLSTSGW